MKKSGKMKSKRDTRDPLARIVIIVSFITIISLIAYHFSSQSSNSTSKQKSQPSSIVPKAAVVDHLSIYSPNQTFTRTTLRILTQAGFAVDYYEWQNVTVSFFRDLPTHNYTLIILRTHSAAVKAEPNYVCIFTSESFRENRYPTEWKTGRLGKARLFTHETDYYFAITPEFVERSMKGVFKNTTIIMMGCNGLTNAIMAKAFIEKGARAYISWDGPVSTSHTDEATGNLLKHLVGENQTVTNAVAATMQEVGPDPICQAKLLFHPRTAGNHHVGSQTHFQPYLAYLRALMPYAFYSHFWRISRIWDAV